MASFYFQEKSGRKGNARNHSDYIARQGRHASKRCDLVATGYGNLPSWAETPREFWIAADAFERANAAVYRESILALPRELDDEQNHQLVKHFIESDLSNKPYQYAIHKPVAAIDEGEQPHAHIISCDRVDDGIPRSKDMYFRRANSKEPALGGCKKVSGGRHPAEMGEDLRRRREQWANLQNAYLESFGHAARVSHLSLREQGVERRPEMHYGPAGARRLGPEDRASIRTERLKNKI